MGELFLRTFDISRYADIPRLFIVVLVKRQSSIMLFGGPVHAYLIFLFKGVEEMAGIFFVDVFNSEIVDG